jgi:hypothetical protein
MTSVHGAGPRNHVFVDFENVHHVDPAVFSLKHLSLTLLMGARQSSLDAELVANMLEHAADVHLVRLTASGKNAVDFALAYYLGRAVLADPEAYFHVISKDTGYDPLIEHLQSRHVRVRRHVDYAGLSLMTTQPMTATEGAKSSAPTLAGDMVSVVAERLRKHPSNRPKKKKTLLSHLKSNLGKDATDADASELLDKLVRAKRISIDAKDGVTYHV